MNETFSDWDLFAAAWLAKTIVVPPPHGETPESYAAKQCDMAVQVADRMVSLKAIRSGLPMQRSVAPGQPPTVIQRLVAELPSGAPVAAPPSQSALTGQPCWRAFNGAQRGQGQDCTGAYDDHGVCKVCLLAYTMPGDPPKPTFATSYIQAPLPPPAGPPAPIVQVKPSIDGSVPPPTFPATPAAGAT